MDGEEKVEEREKKEKREKENYSYLVGMSKGVLSCGRSNRGCRFGLGVISRTARPRCRLSGPNFLSADAPMLVVDGSATPTTASPPRPRPLSTTASATTTSSCLSSSAYFAPRTPSLARSLKHEFGLKPASSPDSASPGLPRLIPQHY